jgi:hypothetical protein
MLLADRRLTSPHQILPVLGGFVDDELVLRRATGVVPGPDHHGPSAAISPSPARIASSTSSAVGRFASTRRPMGGVGSRGDRCRRVIVPSGRAGGGHMADSLARAIASRIDRPRVPLAMRQVVTR